ncbi:MAG TPA: carboxypeptidase regulatory-like domain-containing protein [Xanthobacteraceae bacterium]|nr:carboxypeptidase regulatory-like domain-containing protein [Xanthobacteraceae bacterium]
MKRFVSSSVSAIAIAMFLAATPAPANAQNVGISKNDIGGVVAGPHGPEAGVWVIAETHDTPTRFAKMVVTDDRGRYVVPDLPKGNYDVWVRGYGLIDSPKVKSAPGQHLNLTAVLAPNDAAAAQYYPAIYWFSMLKIPAADQFGGKSDIPEKITQVDWLTTLKNQACVGCHQLGSLGTRTIPAALGSFKTGEDAWARRIQSGQAAPLMINPIAGKFNSVPLKYFGDWTDRIAKGELPSVKPERPQGIERNVVVTTWDWSNDKQYLHDLISSDKRDPTVNAGGKLYGSPEYATDHLPVLDPKTGVVTYITPPEGADVPEAFGPGHAAIAKPMAASAYWGLEQVWDTKFDNHNDMIDQKGRVWMTGTNHAPGTPAFCRKGSDNPYAKAFPIDSNERQLAMYDPKTDKFTFIDTCYGTHHLQFGFDKDNTLWTSGGGMVAGWLNTKVFDETGDVEKAQGWAPFVLDTTGTGKLTAEFTKPGEPRDPNKDMMIGGSGTYAVMPNPADGSVWYTVNVFAGPGGVMRFDPKTKLAEFYKIAAPGFGPRGGDIDSQGVVWVSLASGHIGSFDRSKCKGPLNGPQATGDQCPEGWKFYKYPGPGFAGIGDNSAEASYYSWVDQHNAVGLGKDVPISTGNENDGFVALVDGKMIVLRIPYPMGFYAKGLDARIDDPKAGWKGRGLWSSEGDRTPWLKEGGKGMTPMAVHIQVRPNPLAH